MVDANTLNDVLPLEIGDPSRLRAHPRNYRTHPEAEVIHIAESIRDNGVYRNVVVANDGTILAGHGVVLAVLKLGLNQIAFRRLPIDPDSPAALKVLAGDNEVSRLAIDDDRMLAEMLAQIRDSADTDLLIAAHSHDFIGRKTRRALRLGAIGYHPSLLPLRRGRDAVRWAVKAGDRVTGGTVFWLNDTVDGGPVAAQDWCFVRPRDTAEALWRRELQPMGLALIARVIKEIKGGMLTRIPQDHRLATWEPALNPPPLHRPELPELGNGGWNGYKVRAVRP